MAKSYPELLNNKESRARILAKAAEKAGKGEGLLDLIEEHGQRQPVRKPAKLARNVSRFRWPR